MANSDLDLGFYTRELKIDRHALDRALEDQPALFQSVADEYALAVSRREQAKESLKATDANLSLQIRNDLDAAGEKVTEGSVQARIDRHSKHKAARKKYKDASLEADQWLALKEAYQQRGYALKSLVDLFISSYYQEASAGTGEKARTDHQSSKARQARKAGRRKRERV